jgi:hypothetical protein
MHAWASDFAALPLPRHGAQAAADLAARHTAPGGSDLLIEGARTHAPTISMGALPVFLRFSAPSPRADRPRRAAGPATPRWIDWIPLSIDWIMYSCIRPADFDFTGAS